MAAALNYLYDAKIGYERAIVNGKIESARRRSVLAVQENVVGYLEELCRESWRRDFLKCCKSADRIGLETDAPMVRGSEEPIPFDASGRKIVLP